MILVGLMELENTGGTELFTHIDSVNDTITNVSVLNAATNTGDTNHSSNRRISDGDIIMASGHGSFLWHWFNFWK